MLTIQQLESSLENNLNKSFYYIILFMVLWLFPFLSFSQQEQPKRVTVVVTATETAVQKEIIQLPADNVPQAIDKPSDMVNAKHSEFTAKKTPSVLKNSITKEKPITSPRVAATKTPVVTPKVSVPQNKIKANEETAANKPSAATEKKATTIPSQATLKKPAATTAKPAVQEDKGLVIVKTTTPKENEESIHSTTANSSSYIWIGIFLIIAGVVLGLLFGKPAFLISFVGIVFIALGMLI